MIGGNDVGKAILVPIHHTTSTSSIETQKYGIWLPYNYVDPQTYFHIIACTILNKKSSLAEQLIVVRIARHLQKIPTADTIHNKGLIIITSKKLPYSGKLRNAKFLHQPESNKPPKKIIKHNSRTSFNSKVARVRLIYKSFLCTRKFAQYYRIKFFLLKENTTLTSKH